RAMNTWWSPAATRCEASLSRRADPPFVVVADLPARDRLQRFAKCSALETVAAVAVLTLHLACSS
ncbi:hypothetical protein, partial [[Kitasatospora] papulosa]|uniref:hypothetical protein n=1 Tax=[Kitasatospora] papulosa TaxID=1464011 RepID=UPI0036AA0FD5